MDWFAQTPFDRLNDALLEIHSATSLGRVISALVTHIPKLVPIGSTAGFHVDENWQFTRIISPDLDSQLFFDYKDYYEPFDVYKEIVFARDPLPSVDVSSQLIDYKQWEQSPHRSDFLLPNEMYHLAGIQILVGGQLVGDICLHREEGASDFNPGEVSVLHILQRHASLAARNRLVLTGSSESADVLATAIENSRFGVLVFDQCFRLAYRNSLGQRICEQYRQCAGMGVTLLETLRDLLAHEYAASANLPQPRCNSSWAGSLPLVHYTLAYTVIKNTASSGGVNYIVYLEWRDDGGGPGEPPALPYKLSNREYEIARLLTHGMSNDLIAMALNVSANTVKTHLKNIMRKTGCHTRAEVVYALFGERTQHTGDAPDDEEAGETI